MKEERFPIFKERFYALRQEKCMSQDEFAKFLGLSRPTVSFYENGDRIPDILSLRLIAEKCDVSADYLLGLTDVKTRDADVKAVCEYTGLSEASVRTLRENDDFNLYMPVIDYFINVENYGNSDDSLCLFSNICLFIFNLAKTNNYFYYDKGDFVKSDTIGDMPLSFTTQEVLDRICIDKITGALFKSRDALKSKYDDMIRG